VGHIVCSRASEAQNVNALFFILWWVHCGSHKKRVGTRYAEPAFLDLVGFAGNVVHSSASSP
jgi:hypothetical protein